MNEYLAMSVEYANQRNYLDSLFSVYPTIPEGIRDLDNEKWLVVENAFIDKNNFELINALLRLDLFPIKESYIAYLKRDKDAILRNPNTIDRICGVYMKLG